MPFSTPAEQRAVWDTIGSSKSFLQAVEMPKLGRWFSWNGSAKLQLKEYHTTKMLLESYLEDAPDPSDGPIKFDDLRAAATARIPAEQLAHLKSASGSIDGSSGSSCLDGLGYFSVLVFGSPGWRVHANTARVTGTRDEVRVRCGVGSSPPHRCTGSRYVRKPWMV